MSDVLAAPRLLRGIIVGADFDRLVVQATAADVAAFGRATQVAVTATSASGYATFDGDRYLYNSVGERVAMVIEYRWELASHNMTAFGDNHQQYLGGVPEVYIKAIGCRQ